MKTYGGVKVELRRAVSIKLRPLHPKGKEPLVPSERRLDGGNREKYISSARN
jgi:hypothetical protein